MARSYAESAAARRAKWSDDTKAFAEKAGAYFDEQVEGHRSLGASLVAARKDVTLTQAQLEERSSVLQPEISKIERGVGNPTLETLIKLASALGKKVAFVPDEESSTRHA